MSDLVTQLRHDFGADFPVERGSLTRADPLVVTEERDYVSIEYFVAELLLKAKSLEYLLEQQVVHEVDGHVVDELVYATKPKGAPDWTHTHRYFFDITAGFRRLRSTLSLTHGNTAK